MEDEKFQQVLGTITTGNTQPLTMINDSLSNLQYETLLARCHESKIKSIQFTVTSIQEPFLNFLIQCPEQLQKITLHLTFSEANTQNIKTLSRLLEILPISTLALPYNRLGLQDYQNLLPSLIKAPILTDLDLTKPPHLNFSENPSNFLKDLLGQTKIQTLNLDYWDIDPTAFSVLIESLKDNSYLKCLCLTRHQGSRSAEESGTEFDLCILEEMQESLELLMQKNSSLIKIPGLISPNKEKKDFITQHLAMNRLLSNPKIKAQISQLITKKPADFINGSFPKELLDLIFSYSAFPIKEIIRSLMKDQSKKQDLFKILETHFGSNSEELKTAQDFLNTHFGPKQIKKHDLGKQEKKAPNNSKRRRKKR